MKLFAKSSNYPSLIISEDKVQVLFLDKKKSRVESLAEVRLQDSIVKLGEVKDSDKLAAAIRELFRSANINEQFVVVGIPEDKSYTKLLSLPKLKAEELAEAVIWEAETYLPIAIDQVYLDWKVIDQGEKNELKILLIAVSKEIVDGYTESITKAGLTPVAYETAAVSLVRLVENLKSRNLVVDVGLKNAIITLSDGKLIEASSIISLLNKQGERETAVLSQTIIKMLAYYEGKSDACEKVKTIFLCGQGISQQLIAQINKDTQREVKACPIPIQNLPENQMLNFAVIASLAKKDVKEPDDENTINLLPPQIQKSLNSLEAGKSNRFLLAITTTIIIIVTLASLASLLFLKSGQNQLESKKMSLTPPPTGTGNAIKETNNLNKAAKTIIEIGNKRTFPQIRLAKIIPLIPEEVLVISININEAQHKIRIVGKAKTRSDMLRFKDALENTEEISAAILPLSSLQQSKDVDFILTADLSDYGK